MSLDDRIGDWVLRHVVAPVLWRLDQLLELNLGKPEPPREDLFEEHLYHVVAPHGISLSGYPGTVEYDEDILIPKWLGDVLVREGSVIRRDSVGRVVDIESRMNQIVTDYDTRTTRAIERFYRDLDRRHRPDQ